MLYLLRRQYFNVQAHFDYSLVLAYAFPQSILAPLLPPALKVDTYQEEWGFVAVALVKVKGIRPTFLPSFMGNDLFLVGYRIFVRYDNPPHKRRRGLYVLRSYTDQWPMVLKGNLFTNYRYQHCRIEELQQTQKISIRLRSKSGEGDLLLRANTDPAHQALPLGSPFPDLKTARRFEGPMPFTFSYEAATHSYVIIHGRRSQWHPRPVEVLEADISLLRQAPFNQATPLLANAFIVEHIPYEWKKGVREKVSF